MLVYVTWYSWRQSHSYTHLHNAMDHKQPLEQEIMFKYNQPVN